MRGPNRVVYWVAWFLFVGAGLPARGAGNEIVLHSFDALHGLQPYASLVMDKNGNLFGTTQYGSPANYGTVFEVSPGPNGRWTERVLHAFNLDDGAYPEANLIADSAGNLYGTTAAGGAFSSGNVFRLSPGETGGGFSRSCIRSTFRTGKAQREA